MPDEKEGLRRDIRTLRQGIPAEERAVLSAQASGRLVALPEVMSAEVILGYAANAEEIDPARALSTLRSVGKRIALPRIAGPGALTLHLVESDSDMEVGPHDIPQPKLTTPEILSEEIDIVLVPGVVFDVNGCRIGYGGGYYDRLLSSMPKVFRIGLCFDDQLIGEVPHEEHDERVDTIVTSSQVTRIER